MDAALVALTAVLTGSTIAYTVATFRMVAESRTARTEAAAPSLALRMKRAGQGAVVPTVTNTGRGWLRHGVAEVILEAGDGTADVRRLVVPAMAPGEDIELMPRGTPMLFEDVTMAVSVLHLNWSGVTVSEEVVHGGDTYIVSEWADSIRGNLVRDARTDNERLIDALEIVGKELGHGGPLATCLRRLAVVAERRPSFGTGARWRR